MSFKSLSLHSTPQIPVDESPSPVSVDDLPVNGVQDVRKIVVVFDPINEDEPVVVSNLDSECCYTAEGEFFLHNDMSVQAPCIHSS